jgi:hypothetical protein
MELVLGIGIQPNGTPVSLYCGQSEAHALISIESAGQAGSINIGYIIENPHPVTTLRY